LEVDNLPPSGAVENPLLSKYFNEYFAVFLSMHLVRLCLLLMYIILYVAKTFTKCREGKEELLYNKIQTALFKSSLVISISIQ
jgi:hypothetical protein